MSVVRHHPAHDEYVRSAVANLRREFPEADLDLVTELVSEAFVRISDRGRAPDLVGALAERHVHDMLARERRAPVTSSS